MITINIGNRLCITTNLIKIIHKYCLNQYWYNDCWKNRISILLSLNLKQKVQNDHLLNFYQCYVAELEHLLMACSLYTSTKVENGSLGDIIITRLDSQSRFEVSANWSYWYINFQEDCRILQQYSSSADKTFLFLSLIIVSLLSFILWIANVFSA